MVVCFCSADSFSQRQRRKEHNQIPCQQIEREKGNAEAFDNKSEEQRGEQNGYIGEAHLCADDRLRNLFVKILHGKLRHVREKRPVAEADQKQTDHRRSRILGCGQQHDCKTRTRLAYVNHRFAGQLFYGEPRKESAQRHAHKIKGDDLCAVSGR